MHGPRLVLDQSPLFQGLDEDLLEQVAGLGEFVEVLRGRHLYRAGEPADAVYVLDTGRLALVAGDGTSTAAELGRGDCAGIVAVLTHEPHVTSALALRDCTLLRVDRRGFLALARTHPALLAALSRMLGHALLQRDRADHQGPRPRTAAVVPAGDPDSAHDFSLELARALRRYGNICVLSRQGQFLAGRRLPVKLDFDDPDTHEAVHWLNHLESRFDVVVYVCDPDRTAWTMRSLRQADKLIVVGQAGHPRPPGLAEAWWTGEGRDLVLVLLHDRPGAPGRARDWFPGRRVHRVHHVRADHPEDRARLARYLAGEARALVLGGGGARGFAHLGVLRALEERGITVDLVGGTSMGAFIGAQFAQGLPSGHITENVRRVFLGSPSVFDFTLPMFSLVRGLRVRRRLLDLFGEARIEDLPLPYYCTTTDLTDARPAVHETGSVAMWVGASMAIPGVVPPLVWKGQVHCDGGVLDNVPVSHARRRSSSTVVAVNAESQARLPATADPYSEPLWRLVLRRLSPFHQAGLPDLFQTLSRVASMGSTHLEGPLRPDLEIHPRLGDFGALQFRRIDEIARRGYDEACRVLDRGPLLSGGVAEEGP